MSASASTSAPASSRALAISTALRGVFWWDLGVEEVRVVLVDYPDRLRIARSMGL
jgi:hypothetical protein